MLNRIVVTAAVLGLVALASPVRGSPTINGTVGATEYQTVLNDAAPENTREFYDSGLDIDALHYDTAIDGGTDWYWMGLTVVDEPIDTDGDPSSRLFKSIFWAIFYDNAGVVPDYMVVVDMAGGTPDVTLTEWNGVGWDVVALAGTEYDATIGNALELRIDQLKMPNLDSQPYVYMQLDGTGEWDDDQLEGAVPEPATIGLIGIGLVTALVARRRR